MQLFSGGLELFGPTTDDIYDAFPPTGRAYFADINRAAGSLHNFFNSDDYAVNAGKTWRWVQALKPHGDEYKFTGYSYDQETGAHWSPGDFVRKSDGHILNLAFAPDRYETLAYAAEPRSLALGAQSVAGVFGSTPASQVDLSAIPFGFTEAQWDHSAQFNGSNMVRRTYWAELLRRFGVMV